MNWFLNIVKHELYGAQNSYFMNCFENIVKHVVQIVMTSWNTTIFFSVWIFMHVLPTLIIHKTVSTTTSKSFVTVKLTDANLRSILSNEVY